MANGIGIDPASAPGGEDQGGGPPGGPPGGGAGPPGGGGGPPGGGPLIAALASGQRGPQVSAPGPGDQASSMSLVQTALGMLSQALPGLMGSPMHAEIANVISRLSRRVSRNSAPTVGVQKTQGLDFLQSLARNALLQSISSRQGQQPGGEPDQGGGPAPPMGGGGGGGQPPMPSTPFPGA